MTSGSAAVAAPYTPGYRPPLPLQPDALSLMRLSIDARLDYRFTLPSDFLLQIEMADLPEQVVRNARLELPRAERFARIAGQDGVGERVWLNHHGPLTAHYTAEVEIRRVARPLAGLLAVPLHLLSANAVGYLMPSRYCPPDRFHQFVESEFAGLSGGDAVLAMREWIAQHFSYEPAASTSATTAIDSFVERRGVCRDFAHTLISFARAFGIPARFASVYAPSVTPQDFHAVAEVLLEVRPGVSEWHLVDATGMAREDQIAKIGIGRDAADVSFLTCYGFAELDNKRISVTRLD